MKILSNYLICFSCSCLMTLAQSSFGEVNIASSPDTKQQVHATAGFSYKNPIVVGQVKDDIELLELQKAFMKQWSQDDNYTIRFQRLSMTSKNRLLQIFDVWNNKNQNVLMYFDITEAAKKHHDFKDKNFQKEVEKTLKKGPFKLPAKNQVEKISWAETSEETRQQIWVRLRKDIKKGTLDKKMVEEIQKDVPPSDIPDDIRKDILGKK